MVVIVSKQNYLQRKNTSLSPVHFLTALPSIEALTGMSLIAIKITKTLIIFDSILSLIIIIVLSVFYKNSKEKASYL